MNIMFINTFIYHFLSTFLVYKFVILCQKVYFSYFLVMHFINKLMFIIYFKKEFLPIIIGFILAIFIKQFYILFFNELFLTFYSSIYA